MAIDLRTRHGWEDLKRILDDRIGDVLAICKLDMPSRNGWTLLDDPRGDGRDCFGICIRADGLAWKKFNGTEKGRALELIAYCQGWYHLDKRGALPAANLVISRLGLGSISAEQLEQDRAAAKARAAKAIGEDERRRERSAAAAFAIFAQAKPVLGTLAEIYLREARGIDLRDHPFIGPRGGNLAPGSLRFIPRHRYVIRDKQNRATGEAFAPALVACCTDAQGAIRALHQTWLRGDGRDKASFPNAPDGHKQKPRKVLGEFAGLVIPLWRGAGHLPVREAIENGVVETGVLVEGNEDGLTAVLAKPQYRTWAMISLHNFSNVVARLPANWEAAIVHRQNEWNNGSAVAAFDAGMKALRDSGRMAAEVAAIGGKDLNDTLRGAA